MSIPLHISPRIIPSIASLYNDTNRIFMEYIDNSIDSAEKFYRKETNEYSKHIQITLKITKEDNNIQVKISDNCFGITNFTKVVQSIGNSDKKKETWTNGQFGYGIYSFMAACEKLDIKSKLQNKGALYMPIRRKQFEAEKVEDVLFPEPKILEYKHNSGTEVILSDYDKSMLKQINFEEIKDEIEKHFELLLKRGNLTIKLISEDGITYICKPFDYHSYDGDVFEKHLEEMHFTRGGKYKTKIIETPPKPIYIFLKITKGKTINKPPIFNIKGRRIAEIRDIKQFRSKHKNDIWGHPNITGYIDLSDYLEPTLARNDFKNNNKSRALFNTLEELEPEIMDIIQDVNKETEKQHYQVLEDKLNQALSKLARIDSMNFRTEYLTGNDINLAKDGGGQAFEEGFGEKDRGDEGKGTGGEGWGGENEGEGIGPSGQPGTDTAGGEGKGDFPSATEAENPFADSEFKGGEKKKSGFNIKIADGEPNIDDSTNKPIRSQLIGGTIRIFRKHPDFEERVDNSSRKGEARVSQRLITYLAGEITVHYKDKLQTRHGQPEYNKNMFESLVEFIYQFETMLKSLVGKNLSDLNE